MSLTALPFLLAMTLDATPSASAEPWRQPWIALTLENATLREDYPEGGSSTTLGGITGLSMTWVQPIRPDWEVWLGVRFWEDYSILDAVLPGSLHRRTEYWFTSGAEHQREVLGLTHRLSAGYLTRIVQVSNTFAAPRPSYIFSGNQVFHGPVLGDRLSIPVWNCLSLIGGFSLYPLTWLVLEPGVPDPGLLYGFGGHVGFSSEWGPALGALSYRAETFRRGGSPFQDIAALEVSFAVRL